jgi:hypothetical protein
VDIVTLSDSFLVLRALKCKSHAKKNGANLWAGLSKNKFVQFDQIIEFWHQVVLRPAASCEPSPGNIGSACIQISHLGESMHKQRGAIHKIGEWGGSIMWHNGKM